MRKWKTFLKKCLFLPLWQILVLTIFSAAALLYVFVNGLSTNVLAIVVYVISFYTLSVICIAAVTTFPGYYRTIRGRIYANQYANRYFSDVVYKTHVNLWTSLGINLLYAATNAVSAVIYRTWWFGIFAIYYGIIAIMRFLLARYAKRNSIGENYLGELKRSRVCVYLLLTVNLTLSGVVLMMVYHNRGFSYQGVLIYVIACYTFYTTVTAVVDIVKYRKYHSPVMSVSKVIKLTSSLFSMLFLETAMFSQFGEATPAMTKRIMIMATGAGISVIVIGMSVWILVRSAKEIKVYSHNKESLQ